MSAPISSPEQIKNLSVSELETLADEIRHRILSVCMKNGGHLGASLGAVELAIALHYAFDSPAEPILWDVGHQAYAHKLLTGRWESFSSLRTQGGLSGFPSRAESAHDLFGVGHSSTSLSAALAFAWARTGTARWTIAVIGDGGLTAGLAFEALNNFTVKETGPALIILNDNQMSISKSTGALSAMISGGNAPAFFEGMGLEYIGPVDGHDLRTLTSIFNGLKLRKTSGAPRPVIVHAITQKGKGYAPAEELPEAFHGIGPINGKLNAQTPAFQPKEKTFSEAFGETACALAKADPKIVAITAAMPEGTGLTAFSRTFPERFFDVGIAEGHAVTFAAGLAANGFKPLVAVYSSFLQRGLDQVIHDVALQKLNVVFAIDRAGMVGADGATHHGAFDVSYFGMIPGMTIFAPECLSDLPMLFKKATTVSGPVAIRYPRGSAPTRLLAPLENGIRIHDIISKQEAKFPKLILVSVGSATARVLRALERLGPAAEQIRYVSTPEIKPIPTALVQYLSGFPNTPILCVEDSILRGGFGQSLMSSCLWRTGKFHFVGLPEEFISHGLPSELDEITGLSPRSICNKVLSILSAGNSDEKAN